MLRLWIYQCHDILKTDIVSYFEFNSYFRIIIYQIQDVKSVKSLNKCFCDGGMQNFASNKICVSYLSETIYIITYLKLAAKEVCLLQQIIFSFKSY